MTEITKRYLKENELNIEGFNEIILTKAGNISEIKYLSALNKRATIKKLNKDEYQLLVGEYKGEIRNFKKGETRADNFSILKSMSDLRGIINTNCTDSDKLSWITLTYAQRENKWDEPVPMRDSVRLYNDFKNLMRTIRQEYSDNQIEYITVAEPQQSGSWHMHLILIWDVKFPKIPHKDLEGYWGQGYVGISKVNTKIDNLGSYFSAYLANLELTNDNKKWAEEQGLDIIECVINNETEKTKKFIKGGRLPYYPLYFKLYRCSRGIERPIIIKNHNYAEVDKSKLGTMTYKNGIMLYNKKKGTQQKIIYEYYNRKR